MKIKDNVRKLKNDDFISTTFELTPEETEELDNTGYVENDDYCITKDSDGKIKVYIKYVFWEEIIESKYTYNNRYTEAVEDLCKIRGDGN